MAKEELQARLQELIERQAQENRQQMHDIYSTSVCEATIDEAPMAYKSAEEIEELIGDTVTVVKRISRYITLRRSNNK